MPDFPDGAIPLVPVPSTYAAWWKEIEQCSGRRGDFRAVTFFIYPDRDHVIVDGIGRSAWWNWKDSRIYVTKLSVAEAANVRYAMLRYLLPGAADEPAIYFKGMCSHLVP